MDIYDQYAVVDIEMTSEIFDETYLQILRDLQTEIGGKINTDIRMTVTRSNVDYVIQKINELRVGRYLTEQKKHELVNGLLLFKTRRNGLSLM